MRSRSAWTNSVGQPAPLISRAICSPRSTLRPQIASPAAPRAANSRATASPSPWVPPVIAATLPANCPAVASAAMPLSLLQTPLRTPVAPAHARPKDAAWQAGGGRAVNELRIGLVGAGWMGKAHAVAYRNVPHGVRPRAGGADARGGRRRQSGLGRGGGAQPGLRPLDRGLARGGRRPAGRRGRHHRAERRAPRVALAALAAGKPVYCEKPLANSAAETKEMAEAAAAAGVPTLVGFNYLKNPAHPYARELIRAGELGEITLFRGTFDQDLQSDPDFPFTWRHERAVAGSGALGDMASHTLAFAQYLIGDIVEVCGMCRDLHPRAAARGERHRPERARRRRRGQARGRERRRRPVPAALCERRDRHDRHEPHRHRAQDGPDLRDPGDQGRPVLHPGAHERAQSLPPHRAPGRARLQDPVPRARNIPATPRSTRSRATRSATTTRRSSRRAS